MAMAWLSVLLTQSRYFSSPCPHPPQLARSWVWLSQFNLEIASAIYIVLSSKCNSQKIELHYLLQLFFSEAEQYAGAAYMGNIIG